jgi:hypothetical protein
MVKHFESAAHVDLLDELKRVRAAAIEHTLASQVVCSGVTLRARR